MNLQSCVVLYVEIANARLLTQRLYHLHLLHRPIGPYGDGSFDRMTCPNSNSLSPIQIELPLPLLMLLQQLWLFFVVRKSYQAAFGSIQ